MKKTLASVCCTTRGGGARRLGDEKGHGVVFPSYLHTGFNVKTTRTRALLFLLKDRPHSRASNLRTCRRVGAVFFLLLRTLVCQLGCHEPREQGGLGWCGTVVV